MKPGLCNTDTFYNQLNDAIQTFIPLSMKNGKRTKSWNKKKNKISVFVPSSGMTSFTAHNTYIEDIYIFLKNGKFDSPTKKWIVSVNLILLAQYGHYFSLLYMITCLGFYSIFTSFFYYKESHDTF